MNTETYELTITTFTNGVIRKEWRQGGELHRLDGPAWVQTRPDGSRIERWYQNNKLHRTDGPAAVTEDFLNNEWSREYRYEYWYENGKLLKEVTTKVFK